MKFNPKKVYKARKEAKLTRDGLAFEFERHNLKTTSRTIYNIEKGKTCPNVDDLVSFCIVLDKPVSYFFV